MNIGQQITDKICKSNDSSTVKLNILYTPFDTVNIESYLEKMGVTNVAAYLNPTFDNFEPLEHYANLREAFDMLNSNRDIYILQDVDVDGICSASIIYQYIKSHFNIIPKMVYHTGKMHGIDEEVLSVIPDNILLVIPDASVNTNEYADILLGRNINVICLDHHDIYINTTNVTTVNNQYGNVNNSALSGAGVTHKFCKYLDTQFDTNIAENYYDLVALSIISDSCDITSLENRTYVDYGLSHIKNPFFSFLCDNLIKEDITPHELSFRVINVLNAVCRSHNQDLKNKIFKCFVGEYDDFQNVLTLCKKEKEIQDAKVKDTIENTDVINADNLVVMITEGVDGVSGLIANKLQTKYLKPAFVVHEQNGNYVGSVRSPVGIREQVENNPLFVFNKGHSAAYGTEFPKKNLQSIITLFNNMDLEDAKRYNVIGSYSKVIPNTLFTQFAGYDIMWSQGLPKPLIHYHCTCRGDEWQSLRGATIKLVKNDITFIKFFVSNQQKQLWHIGDNKLYDIDIIGSCSTNTWNNKTTNQVIIEEIIVNERTIW